jgi:excisionase family DNA binding protein
MTEYKSINQVIEELGVHRNTVENWLRSGRLKGVRAGKLWRISTEALEEFLKTRKARRAISNENSSGI